MILNLNALKGAHMRSDPYAWALIHDVIDSCEIRQLSATFPDSGFTLTRRDHGTDKTYLMASRMLVSRDGKQCAGASLCGAWDRLLVALTSVEYRAALTTLTGVDVSGDLMEIGLYRYARGCFVSPHRDKCGKSVGHILYFNETWDIPWGGAFRILGSSDDSDVRESIPPLAGHSVVLIRSETSWHSVEPVSGPVDRLAVHVDFWRVDPGHAPGRETVAAGS